MGLRLFKQIPGSSGQPLILANTTFFVATTGSDITGNGTLAKPYASLYHAAAVAQTYNWNNFSCTIQVAAGTYNMSVVGNNGNGIEPLTNVSSFTIQGDVVTPSNVVLDVTGQSLGVLFNASVFTGGQVMFTGFRIKCDQSAIQIYYWSQFNMGKIEYQCVATGNQNFADLLVVQGPGNFQLLTSIGVFGNSIPNDFESFCNINTEAYADFGATGAGATIVFNTAIDFTGFGVFVAGERGKINLAHTTVTNPGNALGAGFVLQQNSTIRYSSNDPSGFPGSQQGWLDDTSGFGANFGTAIWGASFPVQHVPTTGQTVSMAKYESLCILAPAGPLASLTVKTPDISYGAPPGKKIKVLTTQAITTFALNGNGTTVNNGPTTLAAGSSVTAQLGTDNTWYVG